MTSCSKLGILNWLMAGVLLGSAYLQPTTHLSASLGWIFSLALAILYAFETRPSHWRLLLLGLAVHLTTFHWLAAVIETFGQFSGVVSWLLTLLFALVSSVQFVLMNAVFRGLNKVPFLAANRLALPSAWLTAEVLVPKLVPWMLGHTQITFSHFAQVADIFGVAFISWLMLWLSSVAVSFLRDVICNEEKRTSRKVIWSAFASVIALLLYGQMRIAQVSAAVKNAPRISLVAVQGNLDPLRDFHANKKHINIEKYRQLSLSYTIRKSHDLVIWPESSVGHDYFESDGEIPKGSSLDPFPERTTPLLFGGLTRVVNFRDNLDAYYNSAFLLNANGKIGGVYHKEILFPFSERIPLSNVFPVLNSLWKKKFFLLSGKNQKPLEFRLSRLKEKESIKISTVICYEDMWEKPLLDMTRKYASDFLVALSNDNWFLRSVASRQHHLIASWRAVENRRYFVRATNNGITAVVSPLGETVAALEPFEHGGLESRDVRLLNMKPFLHFVGRELIVIISSLFLVIALVSRASKTD